jgi:hypothetical protein
MDSKKPQKTPNIFYCELCNYKCSNNNDWNKHFLTAKHKMIVNDSINDSKFTQKNPKKFHCELCNFKCSNKKDWNRHILTAKHKKIVNDSINGSCLPPIISLPYTCDCGKSYKYDSGYYRHKKQCKKTPKNPIPNESINNNIRPNNEVNIIDKDLIVKMITHNQDFMKEMMTKMMEMMPQSGNTNSHNTVNNTLTNSNNTNHFNIQMFLNEHCKNAMNLTDFIESLPITAETYDNTLENGLTKSMTHLITNGLSQLDVLERPIHCTDTARKTLYVKENNAWEKDNELLTLIKGIQKIIFKQRTMLKKWQNVNEGWDTNELLQEKMTRLVFHSMKDVGNDEREMGKIIRAISKNVYLDNDTKSKYSKV